jgi:histone demethylase JARID1
MTCFFPTEREFAAGPLAYIESITAQASETGIAHIVPPPSWNPPPLALRTGVDGIDEASFKFGVRVQQTSKLCRRRPDTEGVFGFDRGPRTYTLGEFEARCRLANLRHFGCAAPALEDVEEAFWRIVDSGRDDHGGDISVEYGSDLDNLENGSGFPMPLGLRMSLFEKRCIQDRREPRDRPNLGADRASISSVEAYRSHPWNVNNISLHPRSVLSYLVDPDASAEPDLVSGVMVPWLYVGSTMAAFNWHVEDHALYSVNYLHEGAPKVWYCVPPSESDKFEEAMRDALPELFEVSPDLLCQLVTQLHPRELQARGVDVHRVVHTPRSFIVTMPNVYHTGFNAGFNVAESCNFGALPWLPYSKAVVAKYAQEGFSRPVSISHDMLLVRTIERCQERDIVYEAKRELQQRISELSEFWDAAVEGSVRCCRQQPVTDEIDCAVCQADLWLGGCYHESNPTRMVCFKHAFTIVGTNTSMMMSYRYTLDQLKKICNS